MYVPRHFAENDPAALAGLIEAYPLAAIVSQGGGELTADHIPLMFDAVSQTLRGHVARANPLWRQGLDAPGAPVLAIFRAEQAYISPNWYPSKALTHKAVPTWNYAVVHVHGRLRAVDSAPWLHRLLTELTARHEASQDKPWTLSEAPPDFMAQMMAAVVGIEISVERWVGKLKLSQNRSAADLQGTVDGLAVQADKPSQALASRMQRLAGTGSTP